MKMAVRSASSSTGKSLLSLAPYDVADAMKKNGQHRAYLVPNKQGKIQTSHAMFDEVAEHLKADKRDYNNHEGIFLAIGPKTGALFAACVHNTTRGQPAGGCRYWPYQTFESFLHDGIRLSQGMSRKNALAGLWWGGGKGLVARQNDERYRDPAFRNVLFQEYGTFITSLRGAYYTAEDAGTNVDDMLAIHQQTRFSLCAPPSVGGSGNPSSYTGLGVVCAMEGVLDFLGKGTLQGKTIAVQGTGNVAIAMIDNLFEKGVKKIIASDINPESIERAKQRWAGKPIELRVTKAGDNSILFEEADIVAPCALGGILNDDTIPHIKAKIVCGASNNQLLDDHKHDKDLEKRGITYVPDYLANRMGIVNCANEAYGYLPAGRDDAIYRHFGREWENSLFLMTKKVLQRAKDEKITTATAANKVADELMQVPHPIWPGRARAIIQGLVDDKWETKHGWQ